MVARCICERTLLEYKMLQFLPSMVAAAAIYLTRYLAQQIRAAAAPTAASASAGAGAAPTTAAAETSVWTAKLEKFSGKCEQIKRFLLLFFSYFSFSRHGCKLGSLAIYGLPSLSKRTRHD